MRRLLSYIFDANFHYSAMNGWLLLLRIGVSASLLTHGIPKVNNLMTGNITFADPIGIGVAPSLALAAFAEAGCSILIILGLATRPAAIAQCINMLVAFFIAHAGQPFGKKELAFMYLLFAFTFLIFGAGKYSLDALISRGLNRQTP